VSLIIVLTSFFSEYGLNGAQLWERKLALGHDWAIGLLAGFCPALLMPLFNVELSLSFLPLLLAPFFLLIWTYSYSAVALIALNVSVTTQTSFGQVWRDEFREAPMQYMLLSFIGLSLAITYAMFGFAGFVLTVLPIFVMRLAQEPSMVQIMQMERISAFLGQQLRSAMPASMIQTPIVQAPSTPTAPSVRGIDTARITQYMQFRDQVRMG